MAALGETAARDERRAPVASLGYTPRQTERIEFADWMRQHPGVTDSTLRTYEPVLARLLSPVGYDPRDFGAGALGAFVLVDSARRGPGRAKCIVTAMRTFLRYLVAEGRGAVGLEAAIPTVAH